MTFYTSRQAWQAAVTAHRPATKVTTIGFEGIAPAGGAKSYGAAAGLTLNEVNFLGLSGTSDYGLGVVDSKFYNHVLYDRGTGASLQSSNSCCSLAINRFNITLLSGTYAACADLWSVQLDGLGGNGTDTIRLTLADGATASVTTLVYPGVAFSRVRVSDPRGELELYAEHISRDPRVGQFQFRDTGHQRDSGDQRCRERNWRRR